jgi:hypothetical protein
MTEAVQVSLITGLCVAVPVLTGQALAWSSTRSKIAKVETKVEESKTQNVAIKATVDNVESISDGRLTKALDEISSLKGLVSGLQQIIVKHNGGKP